MSKKEKGSLLSREIIKKKISDEEIGLLCRKYSVILSAGVRAEKCTELIKKQTGDKELRRILEAVHRDLKTGTPLSSSFERNAADKLSPVFYETIKAGESSGELVGIFDSLADYFSDRAGMRKKIKGALIYPVFVLCVAIIVMIVIMTYVMPEMTSIFKSMGGELPMITKMLIGVSDFFSENVAVVIALPVALALGAVIFLKNEKGRLFFDRKKLRAPLIGKINESNFAATFSRVLALLCTAGIPLNKGLLVTADAIDNAYLKEKIRMISRAVTEGKSPSYVMKKVPEFPHALTEMTEIGYESGSLPQVLDGTGKYYSATARQLAENLVSKLEPAMMIFIAALAGFIVFAVYIPMFDMYGLI